LFSRLLFFVRFDILEILEILTAGILDTAQQLFPEGRAGAHKIRGIGAVSFRKF